MILIWDNGRDYSSHEIEFIDIGDVAVEHAEALLHMRHSDGYVSAVAESIEWRRGGTTDLMEMIGPYITDGNTPGVPRSLLFKVLEWERVRLVTMLDNISDADVGSSTRRTNIRRSIADVEKMQTGLPS